MAAITLNAFSFLQKKLKAQGRPYANVSMDVADGTTAVDLLTMMGLEPEDVEAVFVNGRVVSFDTIIKDGDRVGLVPPGTPGPYRVMLGIVQRGNKK